VTPHALDHARSFRLRALREIPLTLIDHGRYALYLPAEAVPGYDHNRTFSRYHQMVREDDQILPSGKETRRVILRTQKCALRARDNPADRINVALEERIARRDEMRAFHTLGCLSRRVRTRVSGRFCRLMQCRMPADFGRSF
jgi:hypothetical protein